MRVQVPRGAAVTSMPNPLSQKRYGPGNTLMLASRYKTLTDWVLARPQMAPGFALPSRPPYNAEHDAAIARLHLALQGANR